MKVYKMLRSFKFAFRGVITLVKSENNFQFHLLAAVFSLMAGFFYDLHTWEWVVILLMIGLVFMAEAFNTAIEKIADFVHPSFSLKIGAIKDISAAGVLMMSACAIIVAILIFGERTLNLFDKWINI